MPYSGEFANKTAHVDIIKNPDVATFLDDCEYLKPPSEEEGTAMGALFQPISLTGDVKLPARVVAFDGSYYESSLDRRLPSTKIGYVRVGAILIQLDDFHQLREGEFVDPFRVAQLKQNNDGLTFALPSANIHTKGRASVRDSFRAAVDAYLYGPKTRFAEEDPSTSLRTTLFHLASQRQGPLGTGDPTRLKLHHCPTCEQGPIELKDIPKAQFCSNCKAEVFPSDCLRFWEEVNEFRSNIEPMSRFMLLVEHLLPIHYIRCLRERPAELLATTAFFIDGPLAVFGNAAWIHASIMSFLCGVNAELVKKGAEPLLVLGLQKTGQVVDHIALIERYIAPGSILAINDDYRYKRVLAAREASENGFGAETYYGQDFIIKTRSGRTFVFGLPYPFTAKNHPGVDFIKNKTEMDRYAQLRRAVALIEHFEFDLYRNSVIPIALAHRYTAISLMPGGRVLDLLTRKSLDRKSSENPPTGNSF